MANNNETNIQNNIASFDEYNWVTRNDEIGYDMDEDCLLLNESLVPEPISFAIAGRAPIKVSKTNQMDHAESSQPIEQKERKSIMVEKIVAKLKLWKNVADECILEIHEVDKGNTTYYKLNRSVVKEKEIIKAEEIQIGNQEMTAITKDVNKPASNKYDLTLQQRLDGPWVFETTPRSGSNPKRRKTNTVYKNPFVKTIRSVNELATFIMYAETF